MSKQKWMVALLLLIICFTGMQFIRPEVKHPPVTGDLSAPAEVKAILKRSCYDCHSNETKLKWFDKIVPAYWLVAEHITEGRQTLNFSNWDSLAPGDQKGNLFLSVNQIRFKEMPRSDYTMLHPDAKLSESDITVLENYLTSISPAKTSDTSRLAVAEKQYNTWINKAATSPDVKPVLNGIAYISDFSTWKAISTTDRFDNNTLRVIFGNDIAVRAIEQQHTNPWPDGTTFAKVAWEQLIDADGQSHAGEFKQVEFMIKGAKKYKSTAGWGWARWKGMDLKPYGKTALFATECVNCHQPLKDNDFVFTNPQSLKEDQLKWKVISSAVDKKNKTMSTLYGNDIAFEYARHPSAGTYPEHAELAMVTWNQKADEHWFGANVPDKIKSIEVVKFNPAPVYQGSGDATTRTAAIIQQRMAVTPY
jgi:cytochrome c553